MEDRINTWLTMLRADFLKYKEQSWFLSSYPYKVDEKSTTLFNQRRSKPATDAELIYLEYFTYAKSMSSFTTKLSKAGIPFTVLWEKTEESLEAKVFCRYTEHGELRLFTLYESEINPPLPELKARLTKPLQLIEYIKQYERERTPLPWDNQAEYAKRYLALKLLKSETQP